MQGMQAIETVYKGYRFRSRTEARWAVFFDTLGVKYTSEPEGYVFKDGTHYLPDFYLPNANMFFEVKGLELSKEDKSKIDKLIIYSGKNVAIGYSDMSFQATSICGEDENGNKTCFLDGKDGSWLIQCHSCEEYQFIGMTGSWECRGCGYYNGDSGFDQYCSGNWPDSYQWSKPYGEVLDAFIKARQARFEHGERPNDLFI